MSTVNQSSGTPPAREEGILRYGFRDRQIKDAQGQIQWVQEPLTLEDVLHPQPGDHVVQSFPHVLDCLYLLMVLHRLFADQPDVAILSDQIVNWDRPELRHHCPDLAVIRGVREQRLWTSFDVAQEGVRPALIIEVTSPDTRSTDLVTKRDQYYRARVPVYVIVDEVPGQQGRRLELIGYERGRGRFRRFRPNARGRLWLEAVGLWLGQQNGRVALYDRRGRRLGDYEEVDRARQQAEERRRQAEEQNQALTQACQQANDQIRALQAELDRLRGQGGSAS